MDNRQTIFWHKRKGFKGEKRRKSLMEKAWRDNYLVWWGGPPGRKRLRRRLSSPRPKTSSFLSEKNEFLKSEDLFNSRTWFHASETPKPLHILKVYDFWFAKTCNAHEPWSRVKIIFLNYVGISGFWRHVTCFKNPKYQNRATRGFFSGTWVRQPP